MHSRRLRRTAAAVVAAVACSAGLAGCGSAHPGAAAQVGDVTISDQTLEDNALAFCDLIAAVNAAQQQPTADVPMRSALLSALNTLVMGEALDQLAERNGVSLSAAEVRQWISQLPLDFSQIPSARDAQLDGITARVARNALLVEKLGRQAYQRQNPQGDAPPPDQIQQLGQQRASDYLERVDVVTDPRYGQVLDTQALPGTGSLSVPVSPEGVDGADVPAPGSALSQTQRCP